MDSIFTLEANYFVICSSISNQRGNQILIIVLMDFQNLTTIKMLNTFFFIQSQISTSTEFAIHQDVSKHFFVYFNVQNKLLFLHDDNGNQIISMFQVTQNDSRTLFLELFLKLFRDFLLKLLVELISEQYLALFLVPFSKELPIHLGHDIWVGFHFNNNISLFYDSQEKGKTLLGTQN